MNRKKVLTVILASTLTLGAVPAGTAFAEEAQTEALTEVQEAAPAEAQAESMTRGQICEMLLTAADDYNNPEATAEQLMEGFADADTEKPATRTEALVMLVRAFGGVPEVKGNNAYLAIQQAEFTDVPEWAAAELSDLFAAGIIEQKEEGILGADDPVTPTDMDHYIRRMYRLYGTNLKDDFYQAVNKEALDTIVIPDGQTSAGNLRTNLINEQINELIAQTAAAEQDKSSEAGKIKTLYENYLNKDARNAQGYEPLKPYLDEVDAATDVADLIGTRAFGKTASFAIFLDSRDSTHYIDLFSSKSITFKDMYEGNDESGKEKLRDYTVELFQLIGYSEEEAQAAFENIFALDTKIAEGSLNVMDTIDVNKTYNLYTLDEICDVFKNVDMNVLFEKSGLKNKDKFLVIDVGSMEAYAELLDNQNLDALKDYLKYALLDAYADNLSDEFVQAKKNYNAAQTGTVGSLSDEENAAKFVESKLGTYVGHLYADKYVDDEMKADITEMIKEMIDIYRERIQGLDWMSDATKEKAIKKLDAMGIKVGEPDEYTGMALDDMELRSYEEGGSLLENMITIEDANQIDIQRYEGQEVDRSEWLQSPQTVNANYTPSYNDVTICAGFLQVPGVYSKDASYEQNLGGLGVVIGHELSHAFDSMGSQYDENGNVVNWWTEEDLAAFAERCQKVVAYYDGREEAPAIPMNGALTLTENTADLGGMSVVLELASRKEDFNYAEMFESWAHLWMGVRYRPVLEKNAATDTHSLDSIRINGLLPNFDEFYETYGITEGDGMWVAPEDRVSIW